MQNYIEWLIQKEYSFHTIKRYRISLEKFIDWYNKRSSNSHPFEPNNISAIDINDWQRELQKEVKENGKPYSATTIQNYIECMKTYLRYLYQTKQIEHNISSDVKVLKVQKINQPKWLDRKEKSIFLNYVDDIRIKERNPWRYYRNLSILFCMMMAGLRESEVVALNTWDVEDGFIYIRNGKGGKARMVPMNEDLTNVLKHWTIERDLYVSADEKALFISQKGGRITVSTIRNLVDRIRNDTSLFTLTPHTLRHTFGHDLAERGVPDRQIADLMGHKDINTTRIYTTPGKEDLIKSVNLLSTGKFKKK